MRGVGSVLGGTLAFTAAGVAYAYVETKLFTVRHVTVPVLPAGQADVRVLHVSDLHLVPRQRRKLAWVRSLADLRPDLVVDTGDNLADVDAVGPLLDAMEPLLTTTPGVFVMGSNDYWGPRPKNPARYLLPDARVFHHEPIPLPWERLAAGFTAAGWKDLDNRRDDVVLADGRRLSFVGTDDAHLDLDKVPARPADAPATGATYDDAVLHLGVTHAPYTRVLQSFQDDGAAIVLAGHTHGGQLRVPGFGALVTNCDLDRRRASGLHGWPGARPDRRNGSDSTWLHVSAGAGTSPYAPVRFACRPEATLLTLTAAATAH
ncbi:metallophosphoesterase [Xylanimonas cellulosilytica DSM 15894]|uniref:Metallophosphoesterase n=1 Tax=Xylanimonas cellulosilytica (strain DSM 15894 / JCM 12276 / CECT 5975 / KCTC 9989 / LMG 20990 / NBRC 107835 / XIL07) TaxID=446471 RepID=D1BZS0_XYLCX|nr:metallophosphoesterase [Xylanimonas cellulosilytica]ACZ32048.1 metallophosphoesterase [Xylanimonas cellulosilytica DSM 15894]